MYETKPLPARQLIFTMKPQKHGRDEIYVRTVSQVEKFAEVTYKALLDFPYHTIYSI